MTRPWPRLRGALIVASIALLTAVFAFVSNVRAGGAIISVDSFALPENLTASTLTAPNQGSVMAKFTTAPPPGTGTAKFVVLTVTLSPLLANATSTSGRCVKAPSSNMFTCNYGSVPAGTTIREFFKFQAPADVGAYPIVSVRVSWDNGTPSGGAGAAQEVFDPTPAVVNVVNANGNLAGKCSDLSGNATASTSTAPISQKVNQQTSFTFGTALSLPSCTWAWVGVSDSVPTGFNTKVSFVTSAELATAGTLLLASKDVKLDPNGTITEFPFFPSLAGAKVLQRCNTTAPFIPTGEDSCLNRIFTDKGISYAEIFHEGLNIDPGYAG
jgi:hypothetical protein